MYLVFDIGGSSVKYALITIEGEIVEKGKRSVPSYSGATSEDFIDQNPYTVWYYTAKDIDAIYPTRYDNYVEEVGYEYINGEVKSDGEAVIYLKNLLEE